MQENAINHVMDQCQGQKKEKNVVTFPYDDITLDFLFLND